MGANTTVNTECHQYFSELSEFIGLNANSNTESTEQKKLIEYIQQTRAPLMQIDKLQGQFLSFFVQAIQANTILEIGSFVGYSTLWLARALPENGQLISCDINATWAERAKQAFIAEQVDHKIIQILQPALDTLTQWPEIHGTQTKQSLYPKAFDLIFIDADKANYPEYYERSLSLLNPNGVIIMDNIWWQGKLVDPNEQQKRTKILREFNQSLAKDTRVNVGWLPIGDGMVLIKTR